MVLLSKALNAHIEEIVEHWRGLMDAWDDEESYHMRLTRFAAKSNWLRYPRRIWALCLFSDNSVDSQVSPRHCAASVLKERLNARLRELNLHDWETHDLGRAISSHASPAEVTGWVRMGIPPEAITKYIDAGVDDPDEARALFEIGVSAEDISDEVLDRLRSGDLASSIAMDVSLSASYDQY